MTGPAPKHKSLTKPVSPLWQRIKTAASDLRPCVVSHGSGVIKALADEVRALEEAPRNKELEYTRKRLVVSQRQLALLQVRVRDFLSESHTKREMTEFLEELAERMEPCEQ